MPRFARALPNGYFAPRLDPIAPERRLAPDEPLVAAYLGGRPVVLARPDPKTRRPGMPADLTVPVTISRLRRALDVERGRVAAPYEPSLVDDWPLTHVPLLYEHGLAGAEPSWWSRWGWLATLTLALSGAAYVVARR